MAIQNTDTSNTTLFPVKLGTTSGTFGVRINPQSGATAPSIVDKNGNTLAEWTNSGGGKWQPIDSNITVGVDNTPIGAFLNQNSETFTKNTTAIINKLPDDQKSGFASANSFNPYTTWSASQSKEPPSPSSGGVNSGDETTTTNNGTFQNKAGVSDINSFTVSSKDNLRKDYGNLSYPLDRGNQEHDFVKFTIVRYGNRKVNDSGLDFQDRSFSKDIKGTVTLPLQSRITDSNSVKWNENSLNSFELASTGIMMAGIQDGGQEAFQKAFTVAQGLTADKATSEAVKTIIASYFAEQGTGTTQLQSRLFGSILNPNLELLFEAPALRSFNYDFKLSARDQNEAKVIKQIIRFFKQGMAVQRSTKNLFLKTPNVFEIEYIFKNNQPHPGLNLIKKCALQAFNVDYTPEGSYMAFNADGTMTSYVLQMQFMELEPVYEDDYPSSPEAIGY